MGRGADEQIESARGGSWLVVAKKDEVLFRRAKKLGGAIKGRIEVR